MSWTKEEVIKKIKSFRDGVDGEERVIKIQNRILTQLIKYFENIEEIENY